MLRGVYLAESCKDLLVLSLDFAETPFSVITPSQLYTRLIVCTIEKHRSGGQVISSEAPCAG